MKAFIREKEKIKINKLKEMTWTTLKIEKNLLNL